MGAEGFAAASEFAGVALELPVASPGVGLGEFAWNTALLGSACVPKRRGMYTPPAISTPTPISAPIASHNPLRDAAAATGAGGATAAAGGVGSDKGIVGAGVGVRTAGGAGIAARAGVGVSIRVVAPVAEGLGFGVTVVPADGSAETGTLFSAALNASAD